MTARQTFRIGGVALLAGAVLSFLTTLLNTFLFVGNDPTPYAGNPLFVPVNILNALGTGLLGLRSPSPATVVNVPSPVPGPEAVEAFRELVGPLPHQARDPQQVPGPFPARHHGPDPLVGLSRGRDRPVHVLGRPVRHLGEDFLGGRRDRLEHRGTWHERAADEQPVGAAQHNP